MRPPVLALLAVIAVITVITAVIGCGAAENGADAADTATATTDTATTDTDTTAIDGATSRYWQWEYPQCHMSGGRCPAGCDSPSSVIVAPTKCGPFVHTQTGACFPNTVVLAGWSCLRRSSDGEVIAYYYRPYTTDGLEPCPANEGYPTGAAPTEGQNLCPADGGAD
jgi:hypothetical protein